MTPRHTLLMRLVGPMQSWGYRSRFEDRDTGLEPTRSGVLGLLASACGVHRGDTTTLTRWDAQLRFGIRVDLPGRKSNHYEKSGFRVETDFHTAQNVLRAAGKGTADTVLSQRHYLADGRFTAGVESTDLELLQTLEAGLKSPVWTLCLGRKSFPLALPPWLPGGGIRTEMTLMEALRSAPFPLLSPMERLPEHVTFVIEAHGDTSEAPPEAIPMRLADRPLDFRTRQYGLRQTALFRLEKTQCDMEEDRCIFPR